MKYEYVIQAYDKNGTTSVPVSVLAYSEKDAINEAKKLIKKDLYQIMEIKIFVSRGESEC